jgi:hypothetical protein
VYPIRPTEESAMNAALQHPLSDRVLCSAMKQAGEHYTPDCPICRDECEHGVDPRHDHATCNVCAAQTEDAMTR